MTEAVVVGSGPNGLAAAIRLAQAGCQVRVLEGADRIGGGTRSTERIVPGLLHDDCAAIHPTGAASPFLSSLGLERYGLTWAWPEVQLAHPLDGGRAGVLWRDEERTAAGLGEDAGAWRRSFGRTARHFDVLAGEVFRPIVHLPRHPVALAEFGLQSLLPASWTVRRFRTPEARGLYAGAAAHAFGSLSGPLSTSIGLMLGAAGHSHGWPVAVGGSQSIATAMAAMLTDLGGKVETGVTVDSLDELGSPDVVLLSVSPTAALSILGDRLPQRVARAYRRYRYGPAAFKVDYAVEGGVPWTNEHARAAGTLHLGGTWEEVAAAESATARGVMPERPFVLAGQQYLADPSRSVGNVHPFYAYAHVPHGYDGDATEAITAQVERFAPGFRDRIVGTHVRSAVDMERYNPNYVGGDINVGANSIMQVAMRPRIARDPYATGVPGVFLSSSATPPGPGVHGMCGYGAAGSALKYLNGGALAQRVA
jgi:phytoene dehydrogenase-like protein